tara:strand:- start:69 stop:338 length:270 start_codon:yes stop_codon:yes gene_type:complete
VSDSFGLKDVSSKDTGKGSKLKTGNLRRSNNMPAKYTKKKSSPLKGKCGKGRVLKNGKCVAKKTTQQALHGSTSLSGILSMRKPKKKKE